MLGLSLPFSKREAPIQAPSPIIGERWLVFIVTLPTGDAEGRMKALRTFETLGCGVLRDGAYLLPDTPATLASFGRLAQFIRSINGTAHVLHAPGTDAIQNSTFRGLFDRGNAYAEITKTIGALKAGFGVSDPSSISRVLQRQREELERLIAIDYFGSPAKAEALRLLTETERAVSTLLFPDASKLTPRGAALKSYVGKTWATGTPLNADRLACAWLIRRFVDADAKILWLGRSDPVPDEITTFGFPEAHFPNSRNHTAFEEMLTVLQLQKNPTLAKIGALVHSLETGDVSHPDAPAFDALLQAKCDSFITATDPIPLDRRHQLIELADRHRLPAVYFTRPFVVAGGLLSYGPSISWMYRAAGSYVSQILKGARPAEMPVLQPTQFEFVLNLGAARKLGLEIPATHMALADELID